MTTNLHSSATQPDVDADRPAGQTQPPVSSSLSMLKIKNPKSKIQNQWGQAMVEFAVALVAIIILVAAMLQIGSLTVQHTHTMTEARRLASQQAMNPATPLIALDAQQIMDWNVGQDRHHYTPDDTAQGSSWMIVPDPVLSAAHPDNLAILVPSNAVSALSGGGLPAEVCGLVKGAHAQQVDILPIIRRLVYDGAFITVESKTWLTWTEGIY